MTGFCEYSILKMKSKCKWGKVDEVSTIITILIILVADTKYESCVPAMYKVYNNHIYTCI